MLGAAREHTSILLRDVAGALRTWRQTPLLPLVAVTALASGMGANAAMFSTRSSRYAASEISRAPVTF